jgi:tRNA-Thr(GGU) m(6)t(6)A37 methyltransferase TsaA
MERWTIRPIARIRSDFGQRFGIPRQPRLVSELKAEVVFESGFDDPSALKGIEEFSHIWLIWGFSETRIDMEKDCPEWSPLVRPPRLGGKVKRGVFATRSPYRPNSLAMSAVRLEDVVIKKGRTSLIVSGADLMDGTPVFDIKPYIPYSDCIPDASEGFACPDKRSADVVFPEDLLDRIPDEKRDALVHVLSLDPRSAYEKSPGGVYGMRFAGYDIRFTTESSEDGCVIRVTDVVSAEGPGFQKIK